MAISRRVTTAGGTLVCALGILYFQQHSDAAHAPEIGLSATEVGYSAPVQPAPEEDLDIVALSTPPLESVRPARVAPSRRLPDIKVSDRTGAAPDIDPRMSACNVTAQASVLPTAVVRLSVVAPCHPGQPATVHHSGLMVTEATDREGRLTLDIPVLSDNAVFLIDFADESGTVALADVPAIHSIERFALQWDGAGKFQIHARENGSDRGGTVTRLGEASAEGARRAEIYTLPVGTGRSYPLDVIVELEVTKQNCGREISAQTIEWRRGSVLSSRDLVFSMPACSAIGDFLVLNDPVDDLMIASK